MITPKPDGYARGIISQLAEYKNGADPHGMMDQSVVDKLKALSEAAVITAADVKTLLDEIVHGSLAVDGIVQLLHLAWMSLLEAERNDAQAKTDPGQAET